MLLHFYHYSKLAPPHTTVLYCTLICSKQTKQNPILVAELSTIQRQIKTEDDATPIINFLINPTTVLFIYFIIYYYYYYAKHIFVRSFVSKIPLSDIDIVPFFSTLIYAFCYFILFNIVMLCYLFVFFRFFN